jgi:hypothetical protein
MMTTMTAVIAVAMGAVMGAVMTNNARVRADAAAAAADASMPKPHILQSQHFQYFFNEFHYPQYDL